MGGTLGGQSGDGEPNLAVGFMLNEVDYDQASYDDAEFIELYNGSGETITLNGLALQMLNGAITNVYTTYDLGLLAQGAGVSTDVPAGGYVVVGPANVIALAPANVTRLPLDVTRDGFIQNGGSDGIILIDIVSGTILDALAYEGGIVGVTETSSGGFAGSRPSTATWALHGTS